MTFNSNLIYSLGRRDFHERVEYPNIPFYIIFDETFRFRHRLVPKKNMCWNGVHKLIDWSADNSTEIEKGWILKADSIKELAEKTGVDASELVKTVSRYNQYCQNREDEDFGRRKQLLYPLETPPYYSAELALTCTNTQGGPNITVKLKHWTNTTIRFPGFTRPVSLDPFSDSFTRAEATYPRRFLSGASQAGMRLLKSHECNQHNKASGYGLLIT